MTGHNRLLRFAFWGGTITPVDSPYPEEEVHHDEEQDRYEKNKSKTKLLHDQLSTRGDVPTLRATYAS